MCTLRGPPPRVQDTFKIQKRQEEASCGLPTALTSHTSASGSSPRPPVFSGPPDTCRPLQASSADLGIWATPPHPHSPRSITRARQGPGGPQPATKPASEGRNAAVKAQKGQRDARLLGTRDGVLDRFSPVPLQTEQQAYGPHVLGGVKARKAQGEGHTPGTPGATARLAPLQDKRVKSEEAP